MQCIQPKLTVFLKLQDCPIKARNASHAKIGLLGMNDDFESFLALCISVLNLQKMEKIVRVDQRASGVNLSIYLNGNNFIITSCCSVLLGTE